MEIKKWKVLLTPHGREYLYGYDECQEDFEIEEGSVFLEQDKWDADDWLEIFSNVTEDHNAHSLASHIHKDISDALKRSGISMKAGEAGTAFAKTFVENYMRSARWLQ